MERKLRALLPGGTFSDVSVKTSRTMSRIRSKGNGTTEKAFRMALIRAGQTGWKLHSDLPGKPDFYFPTARLAIFVDGCFWHGCSECGHVPRTRSVFWRGKLDRNRERDRRVTEELQARGVTVERIWEHELRKGGGLAECTRKINEILHAQSIVGTRPG